MIAPRWRKVVRDLTRRRGRTLLAVLAMAAGILQITAMLAKYAWLQPELTTMYGRTTPSSATLTLDRVSDALVDSVRRVPGVAEVEARPIVMARVRVGDDWVPGVFYVIRDFRRQRLDTFQPDRGAWPPARNEILLERTALRVAQVDVGSRVTLRLPGRADLVARVAGTTWAAGLAPAWMEHMVPGFIAWDSPLRGPGETAQLRIRVADHALSEGYIREVADSVKAMLVRTGHTVTRVTVPPPGRHPHADQMAAFLYLLLAFGVLTFALSTLLVAGMVQALMAEQVREIGILKTIGGSDRQIAGMYLGQVGLLAAAALIMGIPTGLLVGRAYAEFAAGVLNADISHRPFPWTVVAFVSVVGVMVPVLVALVPIARMARITVREALADAGAKPFGARAWDRWLLGLTWVPRPLALTLRTTLVRRGRLALTVGLLACGGAVFMSALNVSSAWVRSVEQDFATRRFDLAVGFVEPQAIARVDAALAPVADVVRAEYWSGASPYLIGPGGVPGEAVSVVGIPPGSRLMAPRLAAGRWLDSTDVRGAVINTATWVRNPGLAVGRPVGIRLAGRTWTFPVVGVAKELVPMPAIYLPRAAVLAATGQDPALAKSVRIVTRRHDDAGQRAAARAVEAALAGSGIEVGALQRTQDTKQGVLDHLVIIMAVLTMAALLVVGVGALALASALTLSVVQRTREIGVLGAIGATPGTIARHVWIEGVLTGVLSWLLALALAAPVTAALEAACGRIFFRVPLDFQMAPSAAAAWLGLVVVIASLASALPARRAARMPVREALAHI